MSDEKVEEAPRMPGMEIAQFNLKATVIVRNSDGKIASVQETQDVTVVQSHFGVTLNELSHQILEQLQKQEAPPLAPQSRAARRKATRELAKEMNG